MTDMGTHYVIEDFVWRETQIEYFGDNPLTTSCVKSVKSLYGTDYIEFPYTCYDWPGDRYFNERYRPIVRNGLNGLIDYTKFHFGKTTVFKHAVLSHRVLSEFSTSVEVIVYEKEIITPYTSILLQKKEKKTMVFDRVEFEFARLPSYLQSYERKFIVNKLNTFNPRKLVNV